MLDIEGAIVSEKELKVFSFSIGLFLILDIFVDGDSVYAQRII